MGDWIPTVGERVKVYGYETQSFGYVERVDVSDNTVMVSGLWRTIDEVEPADEQGGTATGRRAELGKHFPAIVACIDDSVVAIGTVRESAAIELDQLVRERDEARTALANWKRATETGFAKCETCEGDGFMMVDASGGEGPLRPEVCAECEGTGDGRYASILSEARAENAQLQAVLSDLTERIATIADENGGPHPVQSVDSSLSCIEETLAKWWRDWHTERIERERQEAEVARLRGLRFVCDGPPGPEAGRFVELEDAYGNSVSIGEWFERADGYWELRLSAALGKGE